MIAYLDTSALVPLLVDEPSSPACRRLWEAADEIVTVRIAYVETAAALAAARRLGRLGERARATASELLEDLWPQMQIVDVDQLLVERAAHISRVCALRGYDAVHAAAAEGLSGASLVAAAGDRDVLDAWRDLGLATYDTHAA